MQPIALIWPGFICGRYTRSPKRMRIAERRVPISGPLTPLCFRLPNPGLRLWPEPRAGRLLS